MDEKLIFSIIIFIAELSITALTMAALMLLFLEGRWSKKKSICIFWLISFIPSIFCVTSDSIWISKGALIILAPIFMKVIVKDSWGKLILVFLMFYISLIFADTVLFFIISHAGPRWKIDFIGYKDSDGFVEKMMNYEYLRSFYAIFELALLSLVMYVIYIFCRKKQLQISSRAFLPFLFPGLLLLFSVYYHKWFIASNEDMVYASLIHIIVIPFSMLFFLYLLWQTIVAEKRLEVERELKAFYRKEEANIEYYQDVQNRWMENGRFRHDFNNQMQIINCLVEKRDYESLEKADDMIRELLEKVERLGEERDK